MKRLLLLTIFLACLAPVFGQGGKLKKADRKPADSLAVRQFVGDAQLIDASQNVQTRSGGADSLNRSVFTSGQLPQLPAGISRDSALSADGTRTAPYRSPANEAGVRAVTGIFQNRETEARTVIIERERKHEQGQSQLRSLRASDSEEITMKFFRETPRLHVPRPELQIRIDRTETDDIGMTHVRGVRLYRNIPVYGTDFTFHISVESERFAGCILDTMLIDTAAARLSADEAVRIAERDLSLTNAIHPPGDAMRKLLKYDRPPVEAVYYPARLNTLRYCFRVAIRPNFRDEWIYYIDAQSGKIVEKYNATPSAGPAKGTGRDVYGTQRTVDTYEQDGAHYMLNATKPMFNPSDGSGAISVLDARNDRRVHQGADINLATSGSSQWNNPQAISAMYYTGMVYDYLRQTFNRNSFDGMGADMTAVVNVPDEDGNGYDNAFWNGQLIALGNGREDFNTLAGGLDVIAHEFGHAVVSQTARLEYKNQPGAVNECFADIFGAMVDRANWTIGETVVKNRTVFPSGALRDMANPHNGGRSVDDDCWQPAHVSEMYLGQGDNGGVHVNSGIPNYAFYTYATASGKEKAEKVFYRALTNYLTPVSRFVDLRIAAVQSAKDLYGDADAQQVAAAFDRVGILDDAGSAKPSDLPANPGQQGLLIVSADPYDRNTLYKTTDYRTFTPLTQTEMYSTPTVTDDGKTALFVDGSHYIRQLDIAAAREFVLTPDDGYASVAISRDGKRMAIVSVYEDGRIYVYDNDSREWAIFRLYNPTTGSGGARSGGVRYADAIEFDHTGEYLLYDAYSVVGGSIFGGQYDYWDIGLIHVWDNRRNTFGTGGIEKLFTSLEPGVSVGNPVFSKNSPHIIAFDYFDDEGTYATLGVNLATADVDVMFLNSCPSYPSYSMDDKRIAFMTLDGDDYTLYAGYFGLGGDKISTAGDPVIFVSDAAHPVYYGTGTRTLGVKPVAAFSADVRSGGNPLTVQFVDMSDNNPASWNWTFQGGLPSSSTQQHPRITYNTAGTYPVRLMATNSYGSHELVKQGYITVGTTGTEFVEQPPFAVYPNPAGDYALLRGVQGDVAAVRVFDMTGRMYPVSFSNDGQTVRVDVSALHPGMYVLQATLADGKMLTGKMVKN